MSHAQAAVKKSPGYVVNRPCSPYNRDVKSRQIHGWELSIVEAREWQQRLAPQVSREAVAAPPQLVAGVDISVRSDRTARAAVVVLTFPDLAPVETRIAEGNLSFPYVPGLLTFREAPLILAAYEMLSVNPDLILVDGQGIAHPRRFGIASHLGLLLDKPTIGCAKSRLCGVHESPAEYAGSYTEIFDDEEVIGAAVRTKAGTKPIYVSIGHMSDLKTAIRLVLQCCRGYRLPQPTRLAHLAAGGNVASELATRFQISVR
jgi:deoxyribonuclease V